jgi:hypothetical protein
MKNINKLLIIGLIALLSSCQKVINIDLKNKEATVMIEGVVTDNPLTPNTVRITKSVNFSEDNVFPAVSNASVTIRDNAGNTVTLNETSPGVYQNSTLAGVQGRTYYLNITAEGKIYSSVSTMPFKTNLDTVIIGEGGGPGPPGAKSATPIYTDPQGKGNYYRFRLIEKNTKESKESKAILLFDDQIIDGGVNNRSLIDQDLEFKTGDTAIVTMMCIDKDVNLYFYSLSQNGSGPNASATPANPVSNIVGAKLGYFSAHTVQTK